MGNIILQQISINELTDIISSKIRAQFEEINLSKKSELPELLTRKQTANYLGISLVSLYHWTKDGKLQSYQISGRIRYKRDEVLNAIKGVKNLKYRRTL
jgi:excisionase family DNA binding protein